MSNSNDIHYMAHALRLAKRGLYSTDPNPRVGCVIVKEGRIVGEGWHRKAGEPHAEVHALNEAGEQARGATAYVTLEPCSHHGRTPPCAEALCEAGLARVVIAMEDPNPQVAGSGVTRLRGAGIQVDVGILEHDARQLNPGFIKRMEQGRPWIYAKLAVSLDGRTAMASGESQWITGPEARSDVQRLRARCSAILTGVGTVLADDPSMTLRIDQMGKPEAFADPERQPVRVILDSRLRTPPDAKILKQPGRVVILTSEQAASRNKRREPLDRAGAEVVALCEKGAPAWEQVIAWCGQSDFNEVLIEAGPTLTGSAQQSGVVDELWIYQAMTLLGSRACPMMELPLDSMDQQQRLTLLDLRRFGADVRYRLAPDTEVA